jgi:hypothetical protein
VVNSVQHRSSPAELRLALQPVGLPDFGRKRLPCHCTILSRLDAGVPTSAEQPKQKLPCGSR